MNNGIRALIVAALVGVVAVVMLARRGESPAGPQASGASARAMPRLLDLGSTMCIPCKMMAPILEELKTEYAGRLDVEFIDATKQPSVAKKYVVNVIPVQIFFDAAGTERYRHEGFFSKEDILAKWKELGVDLSTAASAPASAVPVAQSGG